MKKKIKKLIHWSFTIFIIIYIITGFGITEFRIIQTLTFGLLTKPSAFYLHSILIYPFIILLIFHILLTLNKKKLNGIRKNMNNEPMQEKDENKRETIRRIIVWIIVFLISIMLLLIVLIQPRFFTFLN